MFLRWNDPNYLKIAGKTKNERGNVGEAKRKDQVYNKDVSKH